MKTYYLIIISFLVVALGCEKDKDLSKTPPETPQLVKYDLNDDSADDFTIEYRWFTWDGINSSGDGISGTIEPLNQNSILFKRKGVTLFNQLNDTIKMEVTEPLYWETFQADLISISNSSENNYLWPNEWKIQSNTTQSSYYLGVKLKENESFLIGWVKFRIEKSTGEIQIIDKKLTSDSYIVIDK
jgi:hypothetical protein